MTSDPPLNSIQVAFTKQDIVPTYASDGDSPEDWSSEPMDAFRLLCPRGGCAPVDQYQVGSVRLLCYFHLQCFS